MLSCSVAEAFAYFNDPDTRETQRFVRTFDRFMDCLNTQSFDEGIHRRKPDLSPYRTPEDTRLKVQHMHAPSVHTIVIFIHTVVGERFPWLPDRVEGQCGEAARIHTCTETVDVFES